MIGQLEGALREKLNLNKKINYAEDFFEIQQKVKVLSGKCFWLWDSFYAFYSRILDVSKKDLELRFPRQTWNKFQVAEMILSELENNNKTEIIKNIISEFYKLSNPIDGKDINKHFTEAKKLLDEFKIIVKNDPIEEEIERRKFTESLSVKLKNDENERHKNNKLTEIKEKFFGYAQSSENQERGFWLEAAFFDILELDNIDCKRPYRTDTEQIDGHFKFNKFDYLVEIKWTKNPVKQEEVSIFKGKIENKAMSTRGIILSISGFDESAILAASNNSRNLIFFDSKDIISILEQMQTFSDIFINKEDGLVRFGKVYQQY